MPPDYVMQGMIADTGDEFHLHKQQHTLALITDWGIHPFEHLRCSPAAQMAIHFAGRAAWLDPFRPTWLLKPKPPSKRTLS